MQKLCTLKTFRQCHAHGGFDHAGARKANQGLGLGNHHVAQERKTGAHAAHGGVGHHADVGQALFGQTGQRCIGLCHLHQGQQAFLHARATGGSKADEGHFLFNRSFDAAHKTLAYDRSHAAAHEFKFEAGCHHAHAMHCTTHDHQGIGFSSVFQGFLEALRVFAAVLEFQGIDR